MDLVKEIARLKEEKKAVILAHFYVRPEVQDVADYLGDSLGLAQMAAKTIAPVIVCCGVHFMAETVTILCPQKKVLIPDPGAGCSLAESIGPEDILHWKAKHPTGCCNLCKYFRSRESVFRLLLYIGQRSAGG
jgi:quinolinate synthase